MKSLNSLGWKIHDHLKEHRPKEFQRLKASGQLFPRLRKLQQQVGDQLHSFEESGLRPDEALEIVRELVYPPSEEDLPVPR